jgi:hypothetical protein
MVLGDLSRTALNREDLFVVFILLTIILVIDISLAKVYGIGLNLYVLSINLKVVIFIILTVFGLFGQYLLVGYVKNKTISSKSSTVLRLQVLHKVFIIFQYALVGILVAVILQILVGNYYSTVLLIAVTSFSYILALIMLGILSLRFFSWFNPFRNSVVLCFGLTSAALVINAIFTLIYVDALLLAKPLTLGPYAGGSAYSVSTAQMLYSGYVITTIISFILTWTATILLLHHYSHKFGKVKYWVIVSAPLIYFLSQFLPLFPNLFDILLNEDPVFYSIILTLIFTWSKIAGGIFFGIAFWLISKNLSHGNIVKDYMNMSAYGFIFLFISNQAIVLVIGPYPPFGLITIAYTGLSSYLILVGIYSSVLSVSQDTRLRQSIRKLANSESKLLDNISTAQMEHEIQSRVIKMTRENQDLMVNETGVQPSLTDEDVKQYLHEVLNEINKIKGATNDKHQKE